jgi:hypothetical protein
MDYNNPNDYWNGYDPCKGMTEKERIKTALAYMVVYFIGFAIAVAVCALLSGCTTTQYVPVIEHRTDTVRITQHQRDSIYLSDSIYVSDFVRDDTVYKTVDRWHTKYIERTSHDTIYQSRHDTIPQPYPVTKEVPAPLTWWQQARIYLGDAVLVAIVLLLVFVMVRRKVF